MTFKKIAERLMEIAPVTGAFYSCFESKIEILFGSKIVSIGGNNESLDRDGDSFTSAREYRLKSGLVINTTVDEDGVLINVMVGTTHRHNGTVYNRKRFGTHNYHQLAVV